MKNDSWKIRDVEIPNRVVIAPMAGISNAAFRVVCKEPDAGLIVCEMISDHEVIYHNKEALEILTVDPREHPMSIQIFGGSEETLVEAAHYVDTHTAADIISINMGCPVPKAAKTDAGARRLLDPDKIYQMVRAVVRDVDRPVTVKMGTDWDQKRVFAAENALVTQEAGANAVAMHGRTRRQIYMGEADWETLKDIADALTIPFIDNGNVTTPEKAKSILEDIGADAAMIGRTTLGNPWITKDMVHYLDTGEKLQPQTVEKKVATTKERLNGLVDFKGKKTTVSEFRHQTTYCLKGIPRSARTRAKINDIRTKQKVFNLLDDFVKKYETRQKQINR